MLKKYDKIMPSDNNCCACAHYPYINYNGYINPHKCPNYGEDGCPFSGIPVSKRRHPGHAIKYYCSQNSYVQKLPVNNLN